MKLVSDSDTAAPGVEETTAPASSKWGTPDLHAVTPDVKLRYWNGIPPYGVWAFIGFLMLEAVLFSNQLVPYCQANFAQPSNCAPIFEKIFPFAIGMILLYPVVAGAARRMGGNRATAQIFVFAAAVVPLLMLSWRYLL